MVAVVGGIAGALFNHIVETLNEWRAHHINAHMWKRVAELVILVLVTGTVAVFLPYFFDCETPTRSMLMEDSIGCLSEEDAHMISQGSVSHSYLTEVLSNCSGGDTADINDKLSKFRAPEEAWDGDVDEWKDFVWLDNADVNRKIQLHYQHSYTCPDRSDFNSMSMLWLNGGVKGVKVLLQRGFPHMLSWQVLLVFFAVYFLFAAYTSGVAVPAGLIVPHLLIGGSYGRAFGLLGIYQKKAMCSALIDLENKAAAGEFDLNSQDYGGSDWMFDDTYFWSTVYRWAGRDCHLPDPGMYAVVGCAAFLSGSGRITMMLATVIIELTDDASLIGPVGVASIIAMIVGNLFNHGLYHGLIPVMNMPFLNEQPADVMNLISVSDIMTRDVICLPKMAPPALVDELIAKYDSGEMSHNAFPIVDKWDPKKPEMMAGKKLRGIISLQNLRLAANCEKTMASDTNKRRSRFLKGTQLNINFSPVQLPGVALVSTDFEGLGSFPLSIAEDLQDELLSWLVHVPLLHDLRSAVLKRMLARMHVGDVDPHDEVIHVGEPGHAMYFLESGSAEALVREKVVKTYGRGEFFGELALITDEPRKATVRAGKDGARVWRLEKLVFQETLNMDRELKLLNFADRSPITVVPHTKVARAFAIFRKLGMRHMCVVDDEYRLVGMLTRKDMMTYKISENLMTPAIEALIRGFVYRWKKRHSENPTTPKKKPRSFGEADAGSSGDRQLGNSVVGVRLGIAAANAKHSVNSRATDLPVDATAIASENASLKKELAELKQQMAQKTLQQMEEAPEASTGAPAERDGAEEEDNETSTLVSRED
eukprot:COSAG02_NODE_306_length_25175_cov_76.540118_18_plen_820_part_00